MLSTSIKTYSSVALADCLDLCAAAQNVQEFVTKDTTASKWSEISEIFSLNFAGGNQHEYSRCILLFMCAKICWLSCIVQLINNFFSFSMF